MKWILQAQERGGTYMFFGQFLITSRVQELLTPNEIMYMYYKVHDLVQTFNGLDYLQVFIQIETGQKIFFIDQLNRQMIASGGFPPEHDHCTLMLAEEY